MTGIELSELKHELRNKSLINLKEYNLEQIKIKGEFVLTAEHYEEKYFGWIYYRWANKYDDNFNVFNRVLRVDGICFIILRSPRVTNRLKGKHVLPVDEQSFYLRIGLASKSLGKILHYEKLPAKIMSELKRLDGYEVKEEVYDYIRASPYSDLKKLPRWLYEKVVSPEYLATQI